MSPLTRLDAIEPRAPRSLWHGRVPRGNITLLVGYGGRGKSTLALHLAARWSRGELTGEPETVLTISCEDDAHTVTVPRLLAAGADADHLHVETDPDAWRFPRDLDRFVAALAATHARVVILDPLVHLVSHLNGPQGRDTLGQLADVARRAGATLVLVHHFIKTARSVEQAIAGSYGVQGIARSILAVDRVAPPLVALILQRLGAEPSEAADLLRVTQHKNSNGPCAPALVLSRTQVPHPADADQSVAVLSELGELKTSLADGPATDGRRAKRDIARELILHLLAPGPRAAEELSAAVTGAEVARKTFERAREELSKDGIIEGYQAHGRHWWKLTVPDYPPA